MFRQIIILYCLISVFACKTTSIISPDEICGIYTSEQCGNLFSNITLELNENGTYKYRSVSFVLDLSSQGKWVHNSRSITLNSFEICEIFICDSIESQIVKWPTNLEIRIVDNRDELLLGAKITNTKTGEKYHSNYNAPIKVKQVSKKDNFEISCLGYQSMEFTCYELIQQKFTMSLSERNGLITPNQESLLFKKQKFRLIKNGLHDIVSECTLNKLIN